MKVIIQAVGDGKETILTDPIEGTYQDVSEFLAGLARQGYTHFSTHRLDLVCDFCGGSGISAIFQIAPGAHIGTLVTDDAEVTHIDPDGKWGACPTCARMISQGQWNALRDRAVEAAPIPDFMRDTFKEMVESGPHYTFRRGYEKGYKLMPVISDDELLGG